MSKYTPGPWQVGPLHKLGISIDARPYTVVAHVRHLAYEATAEQQANARLIAAAPDLLDALEGLVEAETRIGDLPILPTIDTVERVRFALFDAMKDARAALAKAQGERS